MARPPDGLRHRAAPGRASHHVQSPDQRGGHARLHGPEQVRGDRGDARTDTYALGVVLFELLTGRVPFPVDDALEAMRKKVERDPPLVRRLRPDVPEALQAIVYRALRRRPEERYASMAELRHDLTHLDEIQICAYLPDVPRRGRSATCRHGASPSWCSR